MLENAVAVGLQVVRKDVIGKASNRRCGVATGEESLDFIGGDTSERLGAAKLRKVSQKIYRAYVF